MSVQTYSKALLEVATERQQLESVLDEVKALLTIVTENKLSAFFTNAAIKAENKSQVVESLKSQSSDLMKNFLSAIETGGRLSDLPQILEEIESEADKLFKTSDVLVTTAVPLTEAQKEKMARLSKEKFDLNEVTLENKVDAGILGGFIIHARSKIIDASIKRQLTKIAQEIL